MFYSQGAQTICEKTNIFYPSSGDLRNRTIIICDSNIRRFVAIATDEPINFAYK